MTKPLSATLPLLDLDRVLRFSLYSRWAFSAVLGSSLLVFYSMQLALPLLPLAAVAASMAGVNLWLSRNWRNGRPAQWLLALGLLLDILALAIVLGLTGGASNPLAVLFLLPLVMAALVCPPRFSWWLTAQATGLYLMLFFWYLPLPAEQHTGHGDHEALFNMHLVGMWLTFALSAGLITACVSRLVRILGERERRLNQAYQRQDTDERLLVLAMEAASLTHQLSTPLNNLFLLNEELRETSNLPDEVQEDLQLAHAQLKQCAEILSRLKHQSQAEQEPVWLYRALGERLAQWQNLRPEVRVEWQRPAASQDREVRLSPLFWPALFNILNNAADAGEGRIDLHTRLHRNGDWELGVHNRSGVLSEAQLRRAGLDQFDSVKPAGLGLGVWLSHATLSRLNGRLELSNHAEGGVYARILLPLEFIS
ncbi:histidine kinase dimerization/phospho-acceptor domain-containing protein [Oceanimonas baumannii]|uniref:histidine kinase n=1 Tax=Oceanimonas baumannii TaxID=129578 RepID=A0A235CFA3_9GAMM|nr:HAMP domain-containing sensor histidine kinase [Oceanimonas baumannii]OYD23298.1 two-component sensor histidine kinase [Oceanimonas baumannii]TDW58556.1 two-component system sensor histidine kinase RegB [Oceanimonas baumannii]